MMDWRNETTNPQHVGRLWRKVAAAILTAYGRRNINRPASRRASQPIPRLRMPCGNDRCGSVSAPSATDDSFRRGRRRRRPPPPWKVAIAIDVIGDLGTAARCPLAAFFALYPSVCSMNCRASSGRWELRRRIYACRSSHRTALSASVTLAQPRSTTSPLARATHRP
jgi:hypothetical protein